MYTTEAPLVRLLSSQAERRGFHRLKVWAGLSVFLFLAPTGLMALLGSGESLELRWFVSTFAFSMAVLVPVGQLFGDAALLSSLRRGRCLEEVVGTLTPPREVVDQVATFSLVSVLRMGAAVALPLLFGCLIAAAPQDRLEVLVACVAWFPLAAAVVLVGSYTMQAAAVWSRKGETGVAATLLSFGVPAVLCAAWGSPASLGFAAGALVALGIGARWLAIRGLDRACEPVAPVASRAGARGWSVLRNNPIALREACRRSGMPLPRHWLIVGGLALLVAWAASGIPGAREMAALTVGVFAFMQPLFASAETAKAVLLEREGSSLEALASTGLDARTFVDGWAAAAWFPRLVETLLVMLVAGAVALVGNWDGMAFAMFNLPDALARIVLGSYLGLFVAGFAKARRDTVMLLLAAWVGCSLLASVATGIIAATFAMASMSLTGSFMMPLYVGMATALTLFWAVVVRALALSRMRSLFEPQR